MKLHLPVQLFRAVIALMAVAMPFSASAAQKYTVADGQQLTLSGLDKLDLDISGYYYAYGYGGAIYATGMGSINIEQYVSVLFNKNYSKSTEHYGLYACGGVIYCDSGAIKLSGNDRVAFSGNYASTSSDEVTVDAYGGAICSDSGAITLSGNGSVTFTGNYATTSSSVFHYLFAYGGAIYSDSGAVTLSGNDRVTFSGNYAYSSHSSSDRFHSAGGAIFGDGGAITLSGNGSVTFSGNYAKSSTERARGGAICGADGAITLSGNGSVTFSGNYATTTSSSYIAYGGAIYSWSGAITLSENDRVTFSGNYAYSSCDSYNSVGGAICGEVIDIRDNGSVIFKQNYVKNDSLCYLVGLSGDSVALSAASGNYIEFQESMFGYSLELNNLYIDASGKSIAQTGDIIFTGAYAAEHLGAIKSDYTAEELNNSLTSDVAWTTTLYDGRLIIRDGAIFNSAFLTVVSSASGYSTPTVVIENARLNVEYDTICFFSGTCLEAGGQSIISAYSLTLGTGSSLTLHVNEENVDEAVLSLNGIFTLGDSLTLNIAFENVESGVYKLISVNSLSNSENWTKERITVNVLEGDDVNFDHLCWADNKLWLSYGGSIAIWNNISGDREWNTTSKNWKRGEFIDLAIKRCCVIITAHGNDTDKTRPQTPLN